MIVVPYTDGVTGNSSRDTFLNRSPGDDATVDPMHSVSGGDPKDDHRTFDRHCPMLDRGNLTCKQHILKNELHLPACGVNSDIDVLS